MIEKEKKVSEWQKGYGEGFALGMKASLVFIEHLCVETIEKMDLQEEELKKGVRKDEREI